MFLVVFEHSAARHRVPRGPSAPQTAHSRDVQGQAPSLGKTHHPGTVTKIKQPLRGDTPMVRAKLSVRGNSLL